MASTAMEVRVAQTEHMIHKLSSSVSGMDGKRSGYGMVITQNNHEEGVRTSSSTREMDEAPRGVCGDVWNGTLAGNDDRRRGERD